MKFSYVLLGCEGSALDSRILGDALHRHHDLKIPSTRNTIERAFGLLKKWWAILHTPRFFDKKTQVRIINACFILHNFLREEMSEDDLLKEVDQELENSLEDENEVRDEDIVKNIRVTQEWTTFRDILAMQMFEEYQARQV
ncbi:hypothetical protein PTKIN_Ptkin16aG0070900 [Pterospermum kingtungense]